MISFDEFSKTLEEKLKTLNPDASIIIKKVDKNNTQKTGLSISNNNKIKASIGGYSTNLMPIFYLEDFYNNKLTVKDIECIAKWIHNQNKENMISKDDLEFIEMLREFNNVQSSIIFQLVNTEKNKELLKRVPNRPFLDMTVIYKIVILKEDESRISTTVTNDIMKSWNTTENDLWEMAKRNTPKLLSAIRIDMNHFLEEALNDNEFERVVKIIGDNDEDADSMIIVSNMYSYMGAAVILYDNILNMLYKMIGNDLYVAMCSINEFVVISTNEKGVDINNIKNMIKMMISEVIEEEEVLSNKVYYYNGDKGELTIIE